MKSSPPDLSTLPQAVAEFVPPMLCEPTNTLPKGPEWLFEVKLDGYRLLASKPAGEGVTLWSRNRNSLNRKFFYVAEALSFLPDDTLLDGELVALDDAGRPQFTLLQSFRSAAERVRYYAFDLLRLRGRDTTSLPLSDRRELLRELLEDRGDTILLSEAVVGNPTAMLQYVRSHKLEGVIAKRAESAYLPGDRSGAWLKMRVNLAQEFVVGGFTPGTHGIEALLVGFYRGAELLYVVSLRAGFDADSREAMFAKLQDVPRVACPFVNLPQEGARSRWGGEGMTAEKMKAVTWVAPTLVVQVEFLEWSSETSLRHAKFAGLREDKLPREVVKET